MLLSVSCFKLTNTRSTWFMGTRTLVYIVKQRY